MPESLDATQVASQLLGADTDAAHQLVSKLVVEHNATLGNRADRPGGTATFSWRSVEGQSDLGHVEAARDWARRYLERPEDPDHPTGPKGEAGVDNSPVDPFTRMTGRRQR